MSENDVRPDMPTQPPSDDSLSQDESGRARMDTSVGAASPVVPHSEALASQVPLEEPLPTPSAAAETLPASETNEYAEFMSKLHDIESKRTGNDAVDRNIVRRPREKLFKAFFEQHQDLHDPLSIQIAAESQAFRDALFNRRVAEAAKSDMTPLDQAMTKVREFEMLLKEIQQYNHPETPLEKIQLDGKDLKRVRDMRHSLREKLRSVDPEGVRQWIMMTADAEAPARIEAARNKKREAVVSPEATETVQGEQPGGEQPDIPTAENISPSTQEVRNLMHTLGREATASVTERVPQTDEVAHPRTEQDETVSRPDSVDLREQLAQASRSNLSERLDQGPPEVSAPLEDAALEEPQESTAQGVRESLQKASASNLTTRLEQGPPEPLQAVEQAAVSSEEKEREDLRQRLETASASNLAQRLEQGPPPPLDETSQVHQPTPSQPVREDRPHETPLTDAIRARAEQQIARERAGIKTAVLEMLHSQDPYQVARNARGSANGGIGGFAAGAVLSAGATALGRARGSIQQSSPEVSSAPSQATVHTEQGQAPKSGGLLKKLFGWGK